MNRPEPQNALEKDRARIARDLHDELGSALTRIQLLAERLPRGRAAQEDAGLLAEKIAACARETARLLDEIVWATDPENDTVAGLVAYLNQYAGHFFENTEVRCRLEIPSELSSRPLPAQARRGLFLLFKEALNNALKHAQATLVRVGVSETASALEIVIEDNGRGLDSRRMTGDRKGRGLGQMRMRVESLGGGFSITAAPDGGTRVNVSCPIKGQSG
ncbi:MAG: hypothetical protein KGJ60_05760 [Verrucomicrobiota bacterium]|nr:hypothetical protein [Verrucomicrobiota bacterium]